LPPNENSLPPDENSLLPNENSLHVFINKRFKTL